MEVVYKAILTQLQGPKCIHLLDWHLSACHEPGIAKHWGYGLEHGRPSPCPRGTSTVERQTVECEQVLWWGREWLAAVRGAAEKASAGGDLAAETWCPEGWLCLGWKEQSRQRAACADISWNPDKDGSGFLQT